MPSRLPRHLTWLAVAAVTAVGVIVVAGAVDTAVLAATARAMLGDPAGMAVVVLVYASAFALRSLAWIHTLPGLGFAHALSALHVSLGANHVLPLRLGEALRVVSVVRRAGVGLAAATASTVTLRAADVVAVLGVAVALAPGVALGLVGAWWPLVAGAGVLGVSVGVAWLRRLRRAGQCVDLPGAVTLMLIVVSWLLEAVVIWQVAGWAGVEVTAVEAALVTAVAVAAQVAAIAPGGFGTYEAAATAGLVALGVDAGVALAIALGAHAVKTTYALVAGGLAVVWPSPSMVGRLRLPVRREVVPRTSAAGGGDRGERPVVLFLPAHDEEASVASVVGRMPARVAGHPVHCLVVDDGSTDRTAERATHAGAEVVAMGANHGLGAAVRRGLAEGVARDAVAVAFCDADGEYAPEELGDLVAPILTGAADYVVGSRFAGEIQRMLPHRRLGNRILTAGLRFVTRTPISDGQSGYRALSPAAASAAEIVHDFNYAQVLTIDLLAKGYVYAEVPISYRFRETGRSFVRLGRYLTAVVPAVWRLLNPSPAAAGRSSRGLAPP